AGTFPRDADVGCERDGEAAAAGRAVHQADDRLAAAAHAHDDLADAALAVEAGIGSAGRRLRVGRGVAALRRFLDVEAGGKTAAGAAQHDDAHAAVEIELREVVEQLVD